MQIVKDNLPDPCYASLAFNNSLWSSSMAARPCMAMEGHGRPRNYPVRIEAAVDPYEETKKEPADAGQNA